MPAADPRADVEIQVAAEIRPQPGSRRSDKEIARRTAHQHGVMTLAQLEALGLSGRAVRHRLASGRLRRLHRGVYAIGAPSAKGRWVAALLAAGPGAVLSHRSAAALWGLHEDDPAAVGVTVLGRATRMRPGIEMHSGVSLAVSSRTVEAGLPCTTVAQTLLDLASEVDRRALARAVDRAEELRHFDLDALDELLAGSRGRRGVRALAAVLAEYREPTVTRSGAEERLLAIVDGTGLPRPEVNAWVALPGGRGYSPDFLWREVRLIVEVDGRAHHARRRAFRHDRQRDRRLALAGYETRRYAATEVFDDPRRVAAELRAFHARAQRGI